LGTGSEVSTGDGGDCADDGGYCDRAAGQFLYFLNNHQQTSQIANQ
jgi:hypothetical protein